jgi:hypothetical protein
MKKQADDGYEIFLFGFGFGHWKKAATAGRLARGSWTDDFTERNFALSDYQVAGWWPTIMKNIKFSQRVFFTIPATVSPGASQGFQGSDRSSPSFK